MFYSPKCRTVLSVFFGDIVPRFLCIFSCRNQEGGTTPGYSIGALLTKLTALKAMNKCTVPKITSQSIGAVNGDLYWTQCPLNTLEEVVSSLSRRPVSKDQPLVDKDEADLWLNKVLSLGLDTWLFHG